MGAQSECLHSVREYFGISYSGSTRPWGGCSPGSIPGIPTKYRNFPGGCRPGSPLAGGEESCLLICASLKLHRGDSSASLLRRSGRNDRSEGTELDKRVAALSQDCQVSHSLSTGTKNPLSRGSLGGKCGSVAGGKRYLFCFARRSRISVRRSSCLEGLGLVGAACSAGRKRLSCLMNMKTANAVRAKPMILVRKSP